MTDARDGAEGPGAAPDAGRAPDAGGTGAAGTVALMWEARAAEGRGAELLAWARERLPVPEDGPPRGAGTPPGPPGAPPGSRPDAAGFPAPVARPASAGPRAPVPPVPSAAPGPPVPPPTAPLRRELLTAPGGRVLAIFWWPSSGAPEGGGRPVLPEPPGGLVARPVHQWCFTSVEALP